MADYDVQVVLLGASGLPEDQYVNTLHYDVGDGVIFADTVEGVSTQIADAYAGMSTTFSNLWSGDLQVRWYEPGPNPSGPIYVYERTDLTTGGAAAPPEVALCLSYATVDDPAASLPRRRGRIYLGPLAAATTARPSLALQQQLLAFGQALASVGDEQATTWRMYSRADQSYHDIESIWVDDAWDTQRRRGLRPTARIVEDVQ